MEQVLQGLHWTNPLLYLVDMIVITPDFLVHLQRIEEVFRMLHRANSADGVLPDPLLKI